MPIKWTPELDSIVRYPPFSSTSSDDDSYSYSKLLHGVFEETGISFSKALCTKISDRVKATGIGMFSSFGLTSSSPQLIPIDMIFTST